MNKNIYQYIINKLYHKRLLFNHNNKIRNIGGSLVINNLLTKSLAIENLSMYISWIKV